MSDHNSDLKAIRTHTAIIAGVIGITAIVVVSFCVWIIASKAYEQQRYDQDLQQAIEQLR